MKKIIIAIDGYSACGKSSTAKLVASKLGYHFIDTGAMYRAMTLCFLEKGIDLKDREAIMESLNNCEIAFEGTSVLLNNNRVDAEIRSEVVNENVSAVSAIPEVRKKLVLQQQKLGKEKGVAMDGRDIGTVVFPEAELKIFMTADIDVRVSRRMREFAREGIEIDAETVKRNLLERDHIDSTRKDSPLTKAKDAIEIDTTRLTLEVQADQIVEMANRIIYEG